MTNIATSAAAKSKPTTAESTPPVSSTAGSGESSRGFKQMTDTDSASAKQGLFDRLDERERKNLLERCNTRLLQEGEVLFDIGDPGDSCFLVTRGRIELTVRDHTGAKVELASVAAGELFGELSLLDGEARTARATAIEPAELLELNRQELLSFLQAQPEAALDLLAVLSGRIRRTNMLLQDRVARNVNQQVEGHLSIGQRFAGWITDFSGSIPFLNLNIAFFAIWIVINSSLIPGVEAFDPYPFGFLTMAVSLEAIVLSICVLLAQNLQSARDRVRSDIEYEVNLKAELEVAHLHEKVDRLYSEVVKRLHSIEHGHIRQP